ncbi:MAG: ABC transporter ATP-binding protein [Alphaproteobacteria bacterium]|nr:MAG: ABC transporter ATP-binding protein [Alphaproteobacteria bacterium]
MLELRDVDTHYDRVPMLRQVSLRVGAGEVVCLLGPNGAGKTTTFRAITGLARASRGSVTVLGQDVAKVGTERVAALGVGLVPEGRRLFPDLTVRENLWLGYQAAGGGGEFDRRLERAGEIFPRIRERLKQPAGTLSGGEQAMVALARALIGEPRLVVMDEPSLGLSPRLIDEYFEIVAGLRQTGATVLLIEQNAERALRIADRGYVLLKGKVIAEGRARELLEAEVVRHLYF